LLLRETSLETQASNQLATTKPAISKSKRKGNLEKRLHKRARVVGEAAARMPKKKGEKAAGDGEVKHASRGSPCNPETKGGKIAQEKRGGGGQPAPPLPTSGRECSA
jgi:hypothetical protein